MNDVPRQFEDVLDTCLDAILSGKLTLEECLQQYPDHAADLKPALQVALLTTRLNRPAMAAASVAALEMRLQGELLASKSHPQTTAVLLPISRLVATIAIVLFLTVGVGGGAVAASAQARPGDFLYGLKRLWEAIILALSSLTSSTGTTWLHLAHVRLDEIEDLAHRGILDESLLVDLYEASANTLLYVDNGSEAQVIAYVSEAHIRLIDLPETLTRSTVHADLLNLLTINDGVVHTPSSTSPPSLETTLITPDPTNTFSPTATTTPSPTATRTPTATATVTRTRPPLNTVAPSLTPTSRVAATATATQIPTITPSPTTQPSVTPTFTWTPLPLPALPTTDSSGNSPTSAPGGSSNPPTTQPTVDATIRFRATQAILIPTLTAQATMATEEVQP